MKTRIFSRVISAVLVSAMAVGSIASCSDDGAKPSSNEHVHIVSADAEKYAAWISERLDGSIPDKLAVGVGSDEGYDVDMSGYEDDGYIIKKQDDRIVIFGKTADGLDRGVRKYVNAVDSGEAVSETKYHEGARIDTLKLFGTEISGFTIVYPEDHNDNMKFAAEELCQLLKKATGHELPVV
ncbi:MAG: hypothetical protein IKU19_07385, partial [Clostridia bacterium]|nr:hypothetical protein [Clostridia bacterium]